MMEKHYRLLESKPVVCDCGKECPDCDFTEECTVMETKFNLGQFDLEPCEATLVTWLGGFDEEFITVLLTPFLDFEFDEKYSNVADAMKGHITILKKVLKDKKGYLQDIEYCHGVSQV